MADPMSSSDKIVVSGFRHFFTTADGEVQATEPEAPTFSFRSPRALAHVLRAPGELGIGRAYVAGLVEVDDLDRALGIVDTFEAPPLGVGQKLRLGRALVRACGVTLPPRVPAAVSKLM